MGEKKIIYNSILFLSIIVNVVLTILLLFYSSFSKSDKEDGHEISLYYKINVMSFNLGRYAWGGTTPYGLLEEQVNGYIVNYNEFFEENNCDIIFCKKLENILMLNMFLIVMSIFIINYMIIIVIIILQLQLNQGFLLKRRDMAICQQIRHIHILKLIC